MSQQTLNMKLRGLYLHPNPLSSVPEGALRRADNIVIDKESIAETRRGQKTYGNVFSSQAKQLFTYNDFILANYDNKMSYDSNYLGLWVDYAGTYNAPDTTVKIRSFESNGNFYITTQDGIKKLDSVNGNFISAGGIKALDGEATLSGASGFLSNNVSVAYRLVWGYKDANNNEIISAPSQREIVSNDSGGTRDVSIIWQIPSGITASHFYRIYRSGESADLNSEPNDEMQLVKEGSVTSAEITAKEFTVTDLTPNTLKGVTLYSSPSQEGILKANDTPPYAKDVTVFKGSAFYANTKTKQRYITNLVAVGSDDFGYQIEFGDITSGLATITNLSSNALLVLQDLTYLADASGVSGNEISITYTSGATAGSEVVTVVGNSITVQIQDGVSTATQIKTKIDASVPASVLISVTVSGTGGAAQVVNPITYLSGGFDTSLLKAGMKVIGTGIPASTKVLRINSSTQVTLNKNTTSTLSNQSFEFQDVFTISNLEYYAGTSTDESLKQFKVFTDGTASQNIQNTSLELIYMINKDTSNSVLYAYYLSGFEDLPGRILFEERTINGNQFNLATTRGESFNPVLPSLMLIAGASIANPTVITSYAHGLSNGASVVISGSNCTPSINGTYTVSNVTTDTFTIPVNVTVAGTEGFIITFVDQALSANETKQNRVYFSKFQQPESVPLLNYFDVGSANEAIKRIIALRDSVFIFKTDGIFKVSGEDETTFRVSLVDSTSIIRAPESAVAFDNQIFTMSEQGVIAVSDNGVAIMSRPIESTLLQKTASQYTFFDAVTFGISYESDRKYILYTVTQATDQVPTEAYVYNNITQSWTRWSLSRTCGIVNPRDDKMYSANPDNNYVYQERKNFSRTDYADEEFSVSITASSGTSVTLVDTTDLEEGFTLKQGFRESIIQAIVSPTEVTVSGELEWEVSTATVFKPIRSILEWVPNSAMNPGVMKHFREISLFFTDAAFNELSVGFQSNQSSLFESIEVSPQTTTGQWGEFEWGDGPWGGGLGGASVIRTFVPLEKQRAHWLNFRIVCEESFTSFSLAGISTIFNAMSEKVK